MLSRDMLLCKARLAKSMDRYEDVWSVMKVIAQQAQELTLAERSLFSTAFRRCLATRQQAWNILHADRHDVERRLQQVQPLQPPQQPTGSDIFLIDDDEQEEEEQDRVDDSDSQTEDNDDNEAGDTYKHIRDNDIKLRIIQLYQHDLERDMVTLTQEMVALMEDNLIPNSSLDEAKAVYYDMLGDCFKTQIDLVD